MIRMTRFLFGRTVAAAAAALLGASSAAASPTTTWWAPATPATQAFAVPHVTYDTYFGTESLYPIDMGLTMGVIPSDKIGLELGFDFFYPTTTANGGVDVPIALNAKLGLAEGAFGSWQPGVGAGIFGVGFKEDVTNYNVLTLVLGKTLPKVGILSVGGYFGLNDELLVNAEGEARRLGLLASWQSPVLDVPRIDKLLFVADVSTGDNSLGAAGTGVFVYFTPSIALGVGPVYFFTPELQPGGARWMWSMQLDIDIDLRPANSP
jgi:hypothetical protein